MTKLLFCLSWRTIIKKKNQSWDVGITTSGRTCTRDRYGLILINNELLHLVLSRRYSLRCFRICLQYYYVSRYQKFAEKQKEANRHMCI
jgi:hypothetical protein